MKEIFLCDEQQFCQWKELGQAKEDINDLFRYDVRKLEYVTAGVNADIFLFLFVSKGRALCISKAY